MSTHTDGRNPLADERRDVPSVVAAAMEYRRLLNRLASRARLLGSHHPEDAGQEALKRSLENPRSQPAIEYYFSEHPPAGLEPPQWSLDQLFAWLHGVLHYVVLEEHNRASTRREVSATQSTAESDSSHPDPADPMPDQLDVLLQQELESIVEDCFPALEHKYRSVLKMRADGLKYGEIAIQLGVNENTVATLVSRGIRELAMRVRLRMQGFQRAPRAAATRNYE